MRIIVAIFFLFIVSDSFSQADPPFALFRQNEFWFNPAHCAIEKNNIFSFSVRNQWTNTDDNPKTFLFSFEKAFDSTGSRHAIGFIAMHDQWATSNIQQVGLSYRYRCTLTSRINLDFGMRASGINNTIDFSKLTFSQPQPLIPTEKTSSLRPSIDAGMTLGNTNFWNISISAKNINDPTYRYSSLNSNYGRFFFLIAKYKIHFGASSSITPSLLIHMSSPFYDIIFNATYSHKEKIYFGLSFKGINNVNPSVISAGFEIRKRILLMGAYDIPTTILGSSVEGIVKYSF